MNGSILFKDSECQFNFDGKKLRIYANNGEAIDLITDSISKGIRKRTVKKIPFERLEGYSYDDKKKVIFFVNQIGYGYSMQLDEPSKIILEINVKRYLLQNKITNGKTTISFYSKQFGNLFGLIPNYVSEGAVTDKIAEI